MFAKLDIQKMRLTNFMPYSDIVDVISIHNLAAMSPTCLTGAKLTVINRFGNLGTGNNRFKSEVKARNPV